MLRNQEGFTLTEVMLFLAVSGFLVMIALAGLGGRINRVRFTDAMRSLESFFESEESYVRNGMVDSVVPGTACNAGNTVGDCVVLGTQITLTNGSGSIDTQTLVGDRLTIEQQKLDLNSAITESHITPVSSARTYNMDWGLQYFGSGVTIGFLRDPRTSSMLPFNGNPANPTSINANTPDLCFRDNAGNSAKLNFGQTGNTVGVELRFESC